MTWQFLLTSLVVVATPGTGALYTVNAGLVRGRRAALWAAAACTAGIVPHLVAAASGSAALLRVDGVLFGVLVWGGIVYLLVVARGTWRDPGTAWLHRRAPSAGPSRVRVLRDGVVLNLLNPKLTLFFFAFLPQFVVARDPGRAALEMGVLGAAFMVETFVVFAAYGAGAALLRPVIDHRPAALARTNKVFAILYAGLAAGLAVHQLV